MKYQILLILIGFLAFNLLAETKPKPPPVAKPTQPPVAWPAQPTVITPPMFTPNSGGGAPPPPPPRPYIPTAAPSGGSKPIPFKTFESHLVEPKEENYAFSLFRQRKKEGYRSASISTILVGEIPGMMNEQLLALHALKHEAENDALIAKHEYENNLMVMEANKLLFAQTETLYKKNVVGKQVYEESRSNVEKMRWRAEGTRNRMEEYLVEVLLDGLKIHKAKGNDVPTINFARGYVRLWTVRLGKAKAIEGEAQVDFNYSSLVLGMAKELKAKNAATETELIKAQKEADQDEIILKAAQSIVKKNQLNLKEAENIVLEMENNPPPNEG